MKTDGGVGLIRGMHLEGWRLTHEQPLTHIKAIDLSLMKRFLVGIQPIESGLQRLALIRYRSTQGVLLPIRIFYSRHKQVMRQQVGLCTCELQLRMFEIRQE